MVATFVEEDVDMVAGHPLPADKYDVADYAYHMRVNYDDTWVNGPDDPNRSVVIYFRGSGGEEHITGPVVDEALALGYYLISIAPLGTLPDADVSTLRGQNVFKYGYGNVNAPHFTALFIKDAWWAYNGLYRITNGGGSQTHTYAANPKVVLGHSRGASASLSWAAGYAGEGFGPATKTDLPFGLRGILASGSTVAGVGSLNWNDVNRSINTLSGIVNLLPTAPGGSPTPRIAMAYADDDDLAPPDFVKRLQLAIPSLHETYVLSAGDLGHGWTNSASGAPIAMEWVRQLMEQETLLDRFGSPASPGPFVGS